MTEVVLRFESFLRNFTHIVSFFPELTFHVLSYYLAAYYITCFLMKHKSCNGKQFFRASLRLSHQNVRNGRVFGLILWRIFVGFNCVLTLHSKLEDVSLKAHSSTTL